MNDVLEQAVEEYMLGNIPSSAERATASLSEFALRAGIPRSTIYDLARRGALPIPVIRFGKRIVVSRTQMERLLAGEQMSGNSVGA